jgi:leucine dehydrogenase
VRRCPLAEFAIQTYMERYGFKKLLFCNDSNAGLKAIIAIHSTALGPAVGGTRMWTYASEHDAAMDALRLARGMTYKYAAAGVNLGGGKAVIVGDPRRDKSEALFRSFGRMVDQLGGEFLTGEDVGTTLEDMELIYTETDYVVTLPEHCGGVGEISSATALGTIEAMRACAECAWGSPQLRGRRVALQGLGAVGWHALSLLVEEGAEVIVCDTDDEKAGRAVSEMGVRAVPPDSIYDQDVDIFAPYALGGVINERTVPRLKARIVAGSANNIFEDEARDAALLDRRGIVYAVDYIANSGGTILDTDRLRKGGLQRERAMANVRKIRDRIEETFKIARADGISAYLAANRMAEARIKAMEYVRLLG